MADELIGYADLLHEIKKRIRQAQVRAVLSANKEMILLYWCLGLIIAKRQLAEGWGAATIPRLSKDVKNDMPEIKGFSERNLKRMIRFYREYPFLCCGRIDPTQAVKATGFNHRGHREHRVVKPILCVPLCSLWLYPLPMSFMSIALLCIRLTTTEYPFLSEFVPQAVTLLSPEDREQMRHLVVRLPWGHNIMLIEKIKNLKIRVWYMRMTIEQGWSRNVLNLMINSDSYGQEGNAVTNFDQMLPSPQSDLGRQALKDPYIFDFLTLDEPFRERELEVGLMQHPERFLLELGAGFAFIGRQFHFDISGDDFYIDMLFYHLELRCYVAIELKHGAFKPEYAGKMNFYLNVVDDKLKHETDNQSIGMILCQDKKKVLAEYALRGLNKPIGISEYELTRALPEELKSALPTIGEIEAELSGGNETGAGVKSEVGKT